MEFDEAKAHLKSLLLAKDFQLADEHARELYFRHSTRDLGVALTADDISAFANDSANFDHLQNEPFACSIISSNYVEHLLLDSSDRRFPGRMRLDDDEGFIFKTREDDGPYVEIALASSIFLNYFLSNDAINLFLLLRPFFFGDRFIKLGDLRRRFITARVHNLDASSAKIANLRALPLIHACLFTLAYMRNASFQISEDWPQRPPSRRPFRYTDRLERGAIPVPQGRYDENLVRLYQRGVGSIDPVVQFLSYYQVLEYHFMPVSNADLFKKLAAIVSDPAFRSTAKHLSRIVHETTTHRRETDETEMLKLVLREYIDERELISFITRYEEWLQEKIFAKTYHLFGHDLRVTMQEGHVTGGVARRVKHVRNALVHSSDRIEGNERYIPSRANEEKLGKEIPLTRFLAEKVIIGAGSGVT